MEKKLGSRFLEKKLIQMEMQLPKYTGTRRVTGNHSVVRAVPLFPQVTVTHDMKSSRVTIHMLDLLNERSE